MVVLSSFDLFAVYHHDGFVVVNLGRCQGCYGQGQNNQRLLQMLSSDAMGYRRIRRAIGPPDILIWDYLPILDRISGMAT